jgi:hypothetical protein
MAFSAVGLPKNDVLSRSDPFLTGLKQRPAGGADDWVPTFRTEVCGGGEGCVGVGVVFVMAACASV